MYLSVVCNTGVLNECFVEVYLCGVCNSVSYVVKKGWAVLDALARL